MRNTCVGKNNTNSVERRSEETQLRQSRHDQKVTRHTGGLYRGDQRLLVDPTLRKIKSLHIITLIILTFSSILSYPTLPGVRSRLFFMVILHPNFHMFGKEYKENKSQVYPHYSTFPAAHDFSPVPFSPLRYFLFFSLLSLFRYVLFFLLLRLSRYLLSPFLPLCFCLFSISFKFPHSFALFLPLLHHPVYSPLPSVTSSHPFHHLSRYFLYPFLSSPSYFFLSPDSSSP